MVGGSMELFGGDILRGVKGEYVFDTALNPFTYSPPTILI